MSDQTDQSAPLSGDLTDAAYWGRRQEATAANPLPGRPPVWLPAVEPYLRLYEGQRFLELGCSPGLASAAICQRVALRPEGVDFSPQADRYLETMQQIGAADARLHRCDIREFHPEQPYDVVASFGLVEHFDDPLSILREHDRLLRPGGLCVVVIPHFRRLQYLYHYLFDRPDLRMHNIDAMSLAVYSSFAGDREHEIQLLALVGAIHFWNVDLSGPWLIQMARRGLSKVVRKAASRLETWLPPGNRWYAPWLVYVGRKPPVIGP